MTSRGSKKVSPALPIPQPANHRHDASFSSDRNNTDYVTDGSFCRCAGTTKGHLAVFLLKEIIDTAIDFIEASILSSSSSSSTNYASSDAQHAICDDIKNDHDKAAAAAVTSISVGLRMHKTWGVIDFET